MRKLFYLSALVVSSVLAVLLLYVVSKKNEVLNGFERHPPTSIHLPIFSPSDSTELSSDYYLSGQAGDALYLGNRKTSTLHVFDWDTGKLKSVSMNISEARRPLRFLVQSSYVFMTSLSNNQLARIAINDTATSDLISTQRMIADFVPIDKYHVVLKTWNENNTELELGLLSDSGFRLHPSLLEKQIDGKFCTDGRLLFNEELSCVLYVYYYRNQWLVMDTLLSQVKRNLTIDTISHARISVSPIHSQHAESLSSPARITNQLMATSDSLLLIQSLLKADNEDNAIAKSNSAVDVYHLPDGKYLFSFYIPYHDGEALREFQLHGDVLTVRYRHLLVTGRIPH